MINLETIKTHIEEQLNCKYEVVILDRAEASVIYGILVTMLSRRPVGPEP